jgi:hypothetical protein
MEKIAARKILSQQKYATFKLLQTQKSHAQHTILQRIKRSKKRLPKEQPVNEFLSSIAKLLFLEEEGKHNNNNKKAKPVLEKLAHQISFLERL